MQIQPSGDNWELFSQLVRAILSHLLPQSKLSLTFPTENQLPQVHYPVYWSLVKLPHHFAAVSFSTMLWYFNVTGAHKTSAFHLLWHFGRDAKPTTRPRRQGENDCSNQDLNPQLLSPQYNVLTKHLHHLHDLRCFGQKSTDSPQLHYTDLYKTAADVWSQGVVHDFGIVVLIIGDVERILCLNCWRHLLTYTHYWWHLSTYTHFWWHLSTHTHYWWHPLTDTHYWWHLSTYTHFWRHLSTHTHYWWHLLTYTHYWWHLSTYTHFWRHLSTHTLLMAPVDIHTLLTAHVNIHTLLTAPVNIHILLTAPVNMHTLFTHKRSKLSYCPPRHENTQTFILYMWQKQPTLKNMLFV